VKPFFPKRQETYCKFWRLNAHDAQSVQDHLIRKGHDNEEHPDRRKLFRRELFEIDETVGQNETP
jgi:ribosomal protein L44E